MKWTRSAVTTTAAALPVKLVRYRMFDRDVTASASTPAAAQACLTASCRSLSAALGACDMDGTQKLFERGDGGERVLAGLPYRGVGRRRGRRGRVNQEFLRGLLEREA